MDGVLLLAAGAFAIGLLVWVVGKDNHHKEPAPSYGSAPRNASPAVPVRIDTDAAASARAADMLCHAVYEIGGTGDPVDYLPSLTFLSASADAPADDTILWCGCCCIPFSARLRSSGGWFVIGKKDGDPKFLCAVCLEFLNSRERALGLAAPYSVPRDYDVPGHQYARQFPGELPAKIALVRMAVLDKQIEEGGAPFG